MGGRRRLPACRGEKRGKGQKSGFANLNSSPDHRPFHRDNLHYLRISARAVAEFFSPAGRLSAAEVYIQIFEEPASGPLFECFREAYLGALPQAP